MRALFQICLISILIFAKGEIIVLPPPIKEGGMPVNEVFSLRQTIREFKGELTMQELSQLLWAAYGINREAIGYKTVPSSKATFPFDLFVFLRDGVYRYDPANHDLTLVTVGDRRADSGLDEFVETAFANICLAGKYERVKQYGSQEIMELGIRLDAGFVTEAMYLVAAAEGFHAVVRGNINPANALNACGISNKEYYIPVCYSVGR